MVDVCDDFVTYENNVDGAALGYKVTDFFHAMHDGKLRDLGFLSKLDFKTEEDFKAYFLGKTSSLLSEKEATGPSLLEAVFDKTYSKLKGSALSDAYQQFQTRLERFNQNGWKLVDFQTGGAVNRFGEFSSVGFQTGNHFLTSPVGTNNGMDWLQINGPAGLGVFPATEFKTFDAMFQRLKQSNPNGLFTITAHSAGGFVSTAEGMLHPDVTVMNFDPGGIANSLNDYNFKLGSLYGNINPAGNYLNNIHNFGTNVSPLINQLGNYGSFQYYNIQNAKPWDIIKNHGLPNFDLPIGVDPTISQCNIVDPAPTDPLLPKPEPQRNGLWPDGKPKPVIGIPPGAIPNPPLNPFIGDASKDVSGRIVPDRGADNPAPNSDPVDYGDSELDPPDVANGQPPIPQPRIRKIHHHKHRPWWKKLLGIPAAIGAFILLESPLVIDLNNNGIETESLDDSNARFDFQGNGFATATSWLSGNDGFLAVDWNNDGKISDFNELFGDGESNGFNDLQHYDLNGDHVIDSQDPIFSQLRIWQDINGNGVTDTDELFYLASFGISSFNLNAQAQNYTQNENSIDAISTVNKSDGSTFNMYDVNFLTNNSQSTWTGDYEVAEDLVTLPWLRGYGTVKDLLLQATGDADLSALVHNLYLQFNMQSAYQSMDELLARWSGIVGSGSSFSSLTDLQKQNIVEAFLGIDDSLPMTEDNVAQAYQSLIYKAFLDFIAQTPFGVSLGMQYDFEADQHSLDVDFYNNLVENLTNTQTSFASLVLVKALSIAGIIDTAPLAQVISQMGYGSFLLDYFNQQIDFATQNPDGSISGSSTNDLLFTTSSSGVLLQGNDGNDILDSALGSDTLQGGTGNDVYILDLQSGTDTISDTSGVDQLILGAGISQENLVLTQVGNDLLLSIDGTMIATIQNFYTTGTIENISFIDGTTLTSIQILAMSPTISGSTGNDILAGNNFANSISGNAGNDTIMGGAGNDTIDGGVGADSMAGGYGDDIYTVDNSSDIVSEDDLAGIDTVQASVSFTLSSNVENLTLTGSGNLAGVGNELNNTLIANNGVDTLSGGFGDDIYIINNAAAQVTENVGEGTDTVQASISYTLAANLENLTLTGSSALSGTGNSLDNILTGNTAVDTLVGGTGNDTYVVQTAGTVITENAGEGTDTVQASISYTLAANLENLTLTGSSALSGTGNSLDNILTSNTAVDTLVGGQGNDTYVVQTAGTVITENAGEGTDTVQSSVSYTLGVNLENLTLTGSSALTATGNSLSNVITGNTGDDTLDGNTGADTLIGGTGNDTYIIDNTGDQVTENVGEGTDTVQASISYTLAANLENLTLTGSSALSGTGNSLDNILTSNTAVDTLVGGTGNDTYVVQTAGTVITENAGEGTDTVQSSVSYTLGVNLENLTLTGSSALSGTGNSLDNILTGNTAVDTLVGGQGNDTYVVQTAGTVITENANEGTDTVQASVSYTLGANLENLTLTGNQYLSGTGNGGNNILTGNSGNNTLDGSTGQDTLIGGIGNDTYVVDNAGDIIIEDPSGGVDTVQSSISYTLASYVENLSLTGATAINGTGTSYDNWITGNSSTNLLQGLAGNDTLDGGAGSDTLIGGTGNDLYLVDNAGDAVTENVYEGVDTVQTGLSYTLGANLENLTLTGTSALTGRGNALDNILTGNSALDTLIGDTGNDIYILQNASTSITENANEGVDTVEVAANYSLVSTNLENLTLLGSAAYTGTGNTGDNLLTGNTAADTLIGGTGNDTYIIFNANTVITENANEGTDTVQSGLSYTLGANIENLTLAGSGDINGTGNSLSNVITGTEGDNILDGGSGADTLIGGDGSDTYVIDNTNDVITEEAGHGIDTVQSSISYTLSTYLENLTLTGTSNLTGSGNEFDNDLIGNSGANTLTASGGDDILDGGLGADTLIGGTGNDYYLIDNPGDMIQENSGEGMDSVQSTTNYTLSSNVENLTLTDGSATVAVGNTVDNWLVGNSNANTITSLAGNDTLDGGTGSDTLIGGMGDDLYLVDNAGDVVTENANEGTDLVQSSVSYTLGNNLENLSLTGNANLFGNGNSLANQLIGNTGNNSLSGNAGNDTVDGGAGADTLIGGTGDDLYLVDNAGDVVTENVNEGTDTVQSSVSYTLSANVENLILAGSDDLSATGNSQNNILTGNISNNTLDGGTGVDTLIGGTGDDTYVVDNSSDLVIENAGEGMDAVLSSISYTLNNNVENLVLTTGAGAINGSGNTLNNYLIGNDSNNSLFGFAGDDILDGDSGADTLAGGTGNDIYVIDSSDVIQENANEGIDTVQASFSYTLGNNLENLTLTGSQAITGKGNSLDNILSDNGAIDTLIGSTGNDTYILQNTATSIIENNGEGIDTVQVGDNYTLGNYLENLVLTGYNSISGTGNSLDNTITGNSGNNTLDGGIGGDTLIGGTGDDVYIIDNSLDTVVENADEGIDTVQSSISRGLSANVENLTLTGSTALLGTGNSLDNILTGNTGADTLMGGIGNDTYILQNANTVITENTGEGTDTVQIGVSYSLGSNLENLILTGSTALLGTGNSLDNILTGNTGADTLVGGTGNDTYILQNANTVITENTGEGTDTVQVDANYTLANNLESLTLSGTDNVNGTGNTQDNLLMGNLGNNSLSGLAGNDTLNGGGGNDTLIGGTGNDNYIVSTTGLTLIENASEGTDTVQASITYTLAANIENLSLAGTDNINGTGNSLNNLITANSGDNTLDGGLGADTITGGQGNDTYIVDNAGDVVTENTNEGTDTVQSSIDYSLGANVENLTLTGTAILTGTGNSRDNILTGNSAADTLAGGTGNDTYILLNPGTVITEATNAGIDMVQTSNSYTLATNVENLILTGNTAIVGTGNSSDNSITGNSAASTLMGSLGNDTYVINSLDNVIIENAGEGTDSVESTISYTLGNNVENLTLAGTDTISGTGNTLNNSIVGNTNSNVLVGLSGDDTLESVVGLPDTLVGGTGNDFYYVDNLGDVVIENSGEGTDTVYSFVTYTLTSNVENLTLGGSSNISGTGNSLANNILGNSCDNTLDGGLGADTIAGNVGNDTYIVDNAGDVVTENANEGIDTVQTSISYTLGSNVENLILTGTSILTGTGNSLDNILTGNSAADNLIGGTGNDTYILLNAGTVITEAASAGTDTVQIAANYTLGANIENLTLTGTSNLTGTGNSVNNRIIGNAGDNTLDGSTGADTLVGGIGNDTYIVDNTADVITENSGEGIDTVQASATYTLSSFIENLYLTGTSNINGTGSAEANSIIGNSGNNSLSGAAGNDTLDGGSAGSDTLVGGTGDDTYIVNRTGITLVENGSEGIDTVQASISFTLANYFENLTLTGTSNLTGTGTTFDNYLTGNSGNNTLSGLAGNDTLDGGTGTDTLIGGVGDDTYLVDNAGDVITENAGEGTDSVKSTISYILGTNVENLQLISNGAINGTGNTSNNLLYGNSSDNILDGGIGADTLIGGQGNDTYIIDNIGDVVAENANAGSDSVQSSLDYSLGSNLENLTLTGSTAISGSGNTADNNIIGNTNNNILTGYAGNDTLDGGAGIDTLIGGIGNDTYMIDSSSDIVTENASEGVDTIVSTVTYALGTNIENLTLTGNADINATGNSDNNILTGSSGKNYLDGGLGNDTYAFTSNVFGNDTVQDASGNDTLDFSQVGQPLSVDLTSSGMALGGSGKEALLNFNSQAEGSTTITDSVGNTWTSINGAYISSYNPWLAGEKEVAISGNAYLKTTTATSGISLNGDSYGLHMRFRLDNPSNTAYLASGLSVYSLGLYVSGGKLTLLNGNGSNTWFIHSVAGTTVLSSDTWYDVELDYSTTTGYKVFLNGNLEIDQSSVTTKGYDSGGLLIGAQYNGLSNAVGAIADVHINNTTTFHSSNFTPLSLPATLSSTVAWTPNALENLIGGSGNDTLSGSASDNLITGGSGNDSLSGGAGNDTYMFGASYGIDTISDSSGTDMLDFSAFTSGLSINLGGTSFTQSTGNTVNWASGAIENLTTGTGDDSLTGSSGNNVLNAGNGNNTLVGGAGNDTLVGGSGNDTYVFASSGSGTDVINDTQGFNTIDISSYSIGIAANLNNTSLSDGTNTVSWSGSSIQGLITGSGADTLTGNTSDNLLNGGSGNDTLTGDLGNDTLVGGTGNDSLNGGDGNDTYTFGASYGTDTISDSSGSDTLDFSAFTTGLSINLGGTSFTQSTGNTVSWASNAIENITSGSGNDSLTGTAGDNIFTAGSGNDTLNGGDGNDTYVFAASFGTDTISDSLGTDTLDFSAFTAGLSINLGNTSFNQSSGNTVNWASGAMENLTTGTGDDSLTGSSGNNVLNAGNGNNTLVGGAGNDTLIGGSGNDTYSFATGFGIDSMSDTSGIDALDFSAFTSGLTIDLSSTGFTQSVGNSVTWSANSIENLSTGSGDDSLTGSASDNLINAGNGNNTLVGGAGNDTLIGGTGNDTYIFASGFGIDSISDALGSDTIDFTGLTGNLAIDLSASTFNDGAGDMLLWNAGQLDNLLSNSGNDSLAGNASNNSLVAGSGNDTLSGGAGSDTLNGGAGNDTYVFSPGTGNDSIVDASGTDTLDFSAFSTGLTIDLSGSTVTSPATLTSTQKSILGFNSQADGSTTITDLAGNAWTALTGASISSTNAWLTGEKEVAITGNGYLKTTTATSGISLNGDSYGVHMRFNLANAANTAYLACGLSVYSLGLYVSGGKLTLLNGNGSNTWFIHSVAGTTALSSNTWYDVELDYSTTTGYKVFLNGNLEIDQSSITTKGYDSGGLLIGAQYNGLSNAVGTIADVYVNNTTILHNSNFMPYTTGYQSYFNDPISWAGSSIENAIGSSGNDTMTGTTGDNVISGNAGNDSLVGGAGNDTYVFAAGFGIDTINDASGTDTLDFSTFSSALSVDLSTTSFTQSSGNTVSWASGSLENLTTGSGNDSLIGTSANNLLNGGSGNNTINGGAGNDTLFGGIDSDTYVFSGTWGVDLISADSAGTDTVDFTGTTAALTINLTSSGSNEASDGTNTVNWSSDIIENAVGGSGNDTITGSSGNNVLTGGAGNDSLAGGAGNDTYVFANGFGNDTVSDSSGSDTLDFSAVTSNLNITYANASYATNSVSFTSVETVVGGAGIDTFDLSAIGISMTANFGSGTVLAGGATYGFSSIETFKASSGNDSITGNNLANTLIGNGGSDTLTGVGGNDTLNGGVGNDTYLFSKGDGSDLVIDSDSTSGNLDKITLDSTINQGSIALFQTSTHDLQIGYTDSPDDLITVQSQFVANNSVERIELANGKFMTDADINTLIANMTTYATNNGISLTSLNDVKNNAGLMNMVATGWHS